MSHDFHYCVDLLFLKKKEIRNITRVSFDRHKKRGVKLGGF